MPISMKDAMREHGIPAVYRGNPAILLPITDSLAEHLDASRVPATVEAGQMIVAWNEGAQRNGALLHGDARNDLAIAVRRRDGSQLLIGEGVDSVLSMAIEVLRCRKAAREEEARIARQNEESLAEHEAAVARGEARGPFEPAESTFETDAFDRAMGILPFAEVVARKIKADPFSDIVIRAHADTTVAQLVRLSRDMLLPEEKARVDEAWRARAEISVLAPGHADAAPAVIPPAYEGDGAAARSVLSGLPADPAGIAAVQAAAMAASGNRDLSVKIFAVATTTPAHQLAASPLSHAGMRAIDQELARHENREDGPAIIARMQAVTRDAMPTYEWQGKIYTVEAEEGRQVDVLLMRDQYAAFVYAWDAESRIAQLDVDQTVLRYPTPEDVPTEQEVDRLRNVLADLRHDNGAEIDFGWEPARLEGPAA